MEKINVSGKLTISAFTGNRKSWEMSDHNLIVNGGYAAILAGLSGTANKNIAKVQAGTNPAAAAVGNTAITGAVDIAITSFTVVGKTLKIAFNMGANVGNGMAVSEFGLICADGTLFSRKVWPSFQKIEELTIDGLWEINL